VKRGVTMAGLASKGLALVSGSVWAVSSAVVGPTPTDPAEFRECARDARMLGAAKKHTNEGQGGGRNPGVERPDAGRGQSPARSKILSCRNAGFVVSPLVTSNLL